MVRVEKESYRGRDGFIHVPADLADIIEGVFGLDNRRIGKHNDLPTNTVPLTPPQVAALYNFPTNSAAGQTIGILALDGGYKPSDLAKFYASLGPGFTAPTITDVPVDNVVNSGSGDPETTLDICVASAVAQGATIAVYFSKNDQDGWLDAILTAVHPNVNQPMPSVLSISFYFANGDDAATLSREGVSILWVDSVSSAFQDAAMLGVTVLVASGDTGSDSKVGDGKAHVQYPGSDPWVTSCGGTTIGNISGSSFTEIVWNDTVGFGGRNVATGGGVSDHFGVPAWQQSANVPASLNDGTHRGRGVPDVAGNASVASGYPIWVNDIKFTDGGTSAVAPLYAGLIARINARLGVPVGYLNPTLYALGPSVFRDIVAGGTNAVTFTRPDGTKVTSPGYPCGVGWDACTGLGVVDGQQLLARLQQIFQKRCTLVTDRNSFGKEEVDAMLRQAKPAVVQAAFFVTVDGFPPADFGITEGNVEAQRSNPDQNAAPELVLLLPEFGPAGEIRVPGVTIKATALQPTDTTSLARVQRITWTYQIAFADDTGFRFDPKHDTKQVLAVARTKGLVSTAPVTFTLQPNPHEIDGPISWLSTDLRVFQMRSGDRKFGVTMLNTPDRAPDFIQQVIDNLNFGDTDGQRFDDISTDEQASQLELSQTQDGHPVFNFAIARVRYQTTTAQARVRVFFRLFQTTTTGTEYRPNSTYLRGGLGGAVIPLVGIENGEIVSIPCFAAPRVDTTSTSLDAQTDPKNVQTILPDSTGKEVHAYFGCWLDINQTTPVFPIHASSPKGPFTGTDVTSIQRGFMRGGHQCLVAEIAFDPQPIPAGATPALSDRLAQRNLAVVASDNPGLIASHRIPHTFDVTPTTAVAGPGDSPDELMFDWGQLPAGSTAQIYLPAVSADAVLEMATELYPSHTLQRIDAHTLGCEATGMTFMPIPSGIASKFAGLLTLDLPAGLVAGQTFKAVVRQLSNVRPQRQPPPFPHVNIAGATTFAAVQPQFRQVRGTFQVTVPVRTREVLLVPEERLLAVLRWIQLAIPPTNRWYPVFQRYVGQVGDRVGALGGDPSRVQPSPNDERLPDRPPQEVRGRRCDPFEEFEIHCTGKVAGLIYDRFGDFDGFLLDGAHGQRAFASREKELEDLVSYAWRERILITVFAQRHDPCRPASIALRKPPTGIHPWRPTEK